jgi:hypothetical protein
MGNKDNNKKGTALKSVWYNIAPNANTIPFLGLPANLRTTVSDSNYQKFLTAANKRLIKHWMGNLKYISNLTTDEQEKKLYDWFGQEDGRRHFRGWAEQLGKLGGDRDSSGTSAHSKGKAVDINYDYNPWCPLCNHSDNGKKETFTISGEQLNKKNRDAIEAGESTTYTNIQNRCAKVYDRCLRMFVPVVRSTADDNGMKHFARTYYRNNHDWILTDSTTGLPPFSPDQIYKQYQILNWSIRFYFHYVYQQIAEFRKTYPEKPGTPVPAGSKPKKKIDEPEDLPNGYSLHSKSIASSTELWDRIKSDIDKYNLPKEAEILIEKKIFDKHVTDADVKARLFEELTVTYPFESSSETVYRFIYSKSKVTDVKDTDVDTLGKVILEQIKGDHNALSLGMLYTYPGRRDPCNGVFNLSYETFLAMCYLLSSNTQCRMFGAFSPNQAGDMQHFDYGHANRS